MSSDTGFAVSAQKSANSPMKSDGLEGALVADTELSEVDGERGRLILRGFSLEALAPRASLEDIAGLLWHGALPAAGDETLRQAFGAGRVRVHGANPPWQPAVTFRRDGEPPRVAR